MSNNIQQAHDNLYAALNVMLAGDPVPMHDVWSESDDTTFGGPFGGASKGAKAIRDDFTMQANLNLGGNLVANDVTIVEGSDIGYSFCTEVGTDHTMNGELGNLVHRATNIFRLEDGTWKLIHHHTDASGV